MQKEEVNEIKEHIDLVEISKRRWQKKKALHAYRAERKLTQWEIESARSKKISIVYMSASALIN